MYVITKHVTVQLSPVSVKSAQNTFCLHWYRIFLNNNYNSMLYICRWEINYHMRQMVAAKNLYLFIIMFNSTEMEI